MFTGTGINNTAVISAKSGAIMASPAFYAVKFSAGKLVKAAAGNAAIGILIADSPESVAVDDDLNVQIKDCGLWISGAAFAAGALLACDSAGKAVTATAGAFIMGIALEAASDANEVVHVQLTKSGYVPVTDDDTETIAVNDLSDAAITTPENGQVLMYNGTAWVNAAIPAQALAALTGVTLTSPSNGQVLKYNGTAWVNAADAIE